MIYLPSVISSTSPLSPKHWANFHSFSSFAAIFFYLIENVWVAVGYYSFQNFHKSRKNPDWDINKFKSSYSFDRVSNEIPWNQSIFVTQLISKEIVLISLLFFYYLQKVKIKERLIHPMHLRIVRLAKPAWIWIAWSKKKNPGLNFFCENWK